MEVGPNTYHALSYLANLIINLLLTVNSELDQLLWVFNYKLMFRNPESVRLKKLSTEQFKFKSSNLMAKAYLE